MTVESYVELLFFTGGTYYVGVSSHGNDAYNPICGPVPTVVNVTTGGYLAREAGAVIDGPGHRRRTPPERDRRELYERTGRPTDPRPAGRREH